MRNSHPIGTHTDQTCAGCGAAPFTSCGPRCPVPAMNAARAELVNQVSGRIASGLAEPIVEVTA